MRNIPSSPSGYRAYKPGEVDTMVWLLQRAFQEHRLLPAKLAVKPVCAGGTLDQGESKNPPQMDIPLGFALPVL